MCNFNVKVKPGNVKRQKIGQKGEKGMIPTCLMSADCQPCDFHQL